MIYASDGYNGLLILLEKVDGQIMVEFLTYLDETPFGIKSLNLKGILVSLKVLRCFYSIQKKENRTLIAMLKKSLISRCGTMIKH